jgi:hypothetical protein
LFEEELMLATGIRRMDAAEPEWRARARKMLHSLPHDEEGPERALAFRAMVAAATMSAEGLCLLCAVYELLAETDVLRHSLHDSHMVVSSVTERLELLPILEGDVEQFLARCVCDDAYLRGLWEYVRELYAIAHPSHAIARRDGTADRSEDQEGGPCPVRAIG